MNFHNLSKIMDNVNVHNKYLLTSVVARRALQISEMKGSKADIGSGDPDEKAISMALADMEAGNVEVHLRHETVTAAIESELEGESGESKNSEEAVPAEEVPETVTEPVAQE